MTDGKPGKRYHAVRFKDDIKRCPGCNCLILADSFLVHAMFCEPLKLIRDNENNQAYRSGSHLFKRLLKL